MRSMTCLLCGAEDRDVTVRLVDWLEPLDPARPFDRIPRCSDPQACRARVEALEVDNVWPVRDWTKPSRAAASAVDPQETDRAAASAELEVRSWL